LLAYLLTYLHYTVLGHTGVSEGCRSDGRRSRSTQLTMIWTGIGIKHNSERRGILIQQRLPINLPAA